MSEEPVYRKKKKWKTRQRRSKSRVWKTRWVEAKGGKTTAQSK